MSTKRISGKDFHIQLGSRMLKVETASLSISDNRAAVYTNGVPNGYVDGDVSASGDLVLDSQNFAMLVETARGAGSFKDIKPFDVIFFAQTSTRMQVEAFGCLLKVADLLDIDSKGGDKSTHKIEFEVTDPDFIKINGVPYLSITELNGIF